MRAVARGKRSTDAPGEPLHVDIWKLSEDDAAFRLVATERNVVVEDFGRFEYER